MITGRPCVTKLSKTAVYVHDVPEITKILFKKACYKTGKPMRAVLVELMSEYVRKTL